MRTPAAAACLALLVAGCGYHTRFDLPPHLQTFSVAAFTNKTLERNLDFEFTQALIHEVLAKTRLRVAPPGQADLVITGEIARFERQTLVRKGLGLKSQMRYIAYANVAMMDRRKDRMFFEGKDINWRAEFRMNRGETPVQGREELARELARHVVSLAFERWPDKPREGQPGAR